MQTPQKNTLRQEIEQICWFLEQARSFDLNTQVALGEWLEDIAAQNIQQISFRTACIATAAARVMENIIMETVYVIRLKDCMESAGGIKKDYSADYKPNLKTSIEQMLLVELERIAKSPHLVQRGPLYDLYNN